MGMSITRTLCNYSTKLQDYKLSCQVTKQTELEYPRYWGSQPMILNEFFRQDEAFILIHWRTWINSKCRNEWFRYQRQQSSLRWNRLNNHTRHNFCFVVVQLERFRFFVNQIVKLRR